MDMVVLSPPPFSQLIISCFFNFSGADLAALIREASLLALQDVINNSSTSTKSTKTSVAKKHFEDAFKKIRASSLR